MQKNNLAANQYTAAIFDEVGNADVCLCTEGELRVNKVIARIYDAERNKMRIISIPSFDEVWEASR